MKTSIDHILTTHVGSLPRTPKLLEMLYARHQNEDFDDRSFATETTQAVKEIVKGQVEAGIDVVSDGEMAKISYAQYVKHRLAGLGDQKSEPGRGKGPPGDFSLPLDFADHPDWMAGTRGASPAMVVAPVCTSAISYEDREPLETDLDNFKAAVEDAQPLDGFMNAASPGIISQFCPDHHYGDQATYIEALGEAMQTEYEAIVDAGFNVQLDCPDLAANRHMVFTDMSDEEFLKGAEHRVEVLNHATRNIAPEKMRMHICWGNYAGPHDHDFPVAKLTGVLSRARPQALLFEGANPAHAHEWEDWAAAEIPDDKILVPGVIDSVSNFVEHPRLVEQHICRYADIVGRERVIAGTDCGFNTFASEPQVYPSVMWSKFRSLAEGAQRASDKLWGKA